jgi:hypothetical protein
MVLLATALLLVAGLFHAMKVVRQPGYAETAGDPAIQLQDSAFTLRDTPCDILIYGDSTANVGIDPRVITAQTRLTACNIATNRPDVDDLGTLPLDAFLQHNPKPKLLVLQYGPEVFYRAKSPWEHNGPYTPLLILSRDLPQSQALPIMLRHPAETTQFVLYILQNELFPRKLDRDKLDRQFHYALQHAAESHGQLDLNLPAETACRAPALALNGPLDTAWPHQLHQRYEAIGIPVLIRAAPIPACDPQLALFQRDLAPYVDSNVESLPINLFVAGDRHTTLQGAEIQTTQLAAFIRAHNPHPTQ